MVFRNRVRALLVYPEFRRGARRNKGTRQNESETF